MHDAANRGLLQRDDAAELRIVRHVQRGKLQLHRDEHGVCRRELHKWGCVDCGRVCERRMPSGCEHDVQLRVFRVALRGRSVCRSFVYYAAKCGLPQRDDAAELRVVGHV